MNSFFAWLRRPRTFQLSPLTGLLATAGIVALLFIGSRFSGRSEIPTLPAAVVGQPASGQVMQFVLVAPEAGSVSLVGDFNDWNLSATPLVRQAEDGVWWVTVPLAPGRYRYAFVVDGRRWRNDPNAPSAEDEFGGRNSVVTIGGT
jgi:1,4-alpha-glucan branching enzyme